MIDRNSVRFLNFCRSNGVQFGATLTLGCQAINESSFDGCDSKTLPYFSSGGDPPYSSRRLFEVLGAHRFDEMDFSDYEGANVLWNLNDPVAESLEETYDLVFDGGTLEHVFNVAEGLRNCMRMVKVGGHLILHHPSNNWFGHGFYQLSPEFYFRALSPENGFQLKKIVIHDATDRWMEIVDPNSVHRRAEVFGPDRLMSLICAQKVRACPIFQTWPSQSDYASLWVEDDAAGVAAEGGKGWVNHHDPRASSKSDIGRSIKNRMPGALKRALHRHLPFLSKRYAFGNKLHFRSFSSHPDK